MTYCRVMQGRKPKNKKPHNSQYKRRSKLNKVTTEIVVRSSFDRIEYSQKGHRKGKSVE